MRCAQYLVNRSLWLDESLLALNIVHRTFSQLMQPLDYEQMAPLAFLMIERAAVQFFGNSEYALRLFPFLSGLVSLFLFYKVAKTVLTQRAFIIGLMLFVFSGPLIYYSSEVKQYGSDVTISLLLYFLTLQCIKKNKFHIWDAILFGIVWLCCNLDFTSSRIYSSRNRNSFSLVFLKRKE